MYPSIMLIVRVVYTCFVADTINGRIIFILTIVYVWIIFCSVNYLFKYSVKTIITKYIR